jgi:hypothetical protein
MTASDDKKIKTNSALENPPEKKSTSGWRRAIQG